MSGHTKGPWSITRSKLATDGAFDYAIGGADGSLVIAEAFGRDAKGGWPPAEANANLIAAAPDMLTSLKALVEQHIRRGGAFDEPLGESEQEPEINMALAVIARAEGRQP